MTLLAHQAIMTPGGVTDPFWANVVVLLHFDGADTSTTFTDQTGKVWTAFGNAQLDTAQFKWPPSSLLLDGSGDYATTPSSADFAYGTGDFTWEAWMRCAGFTGSNQYAYDHGANGGGLLINNSGGRLAYYNTTTGIGSSLFTSGPVITLNTWQHIAVTRASGTTRLFLDGIVGASASDSHSFASQALSIGRFGGGGFNFNGHIDDARLTKGVARYTANFTPPAAPFPNS